MNRVLLIAVIILSLGIGGIIGYAYGNYSTTPSTPVDTPDSQRSQPRYTQQQVADIQAELEEIEAALIKNEEQQKDTEEKISSYEIQQAVACVFLALNRHYYGLNPQSMVDTSIQLERESRAKLQELRAQHQKLFERKLLLMVKLGAIQ